MARTRYSLLQVLFDHFVLLSLFTMYFAVLVQLISEPASMPESILFRYRTNFLDVLRLKSRLVRSSNRNITAVFTILNKLPPINSSTILESITTATITTATVDIDHDNDKPINELEKEDSDSDTESEINFVLQKKCGQTFRHGIDTTRSSRIVGGDIVKNGEFPWMVSKSKAKQRKHLHVQCMFL